MDEEEISWTPLSANNPNRALLREVEDLPVKLMIAEDDEPIRRMLKRALINERYEIVEAEDGEQAWQALQNKRNPPRHSRLDDAQNRWALSLPKDKSARKSVCLYHHAHRQGE